MPSFTRNADFRCINCGATDQIGSWGALAKPCSKVPADKDAIVEAMARAIWLCDQDEVTYDEAVVAALHGDKFSKSRIKWVWQLAETALTAALPLLQPEWQPIETARSLKNGTEILAYREDAGSFIAMFGALDIFPLTQGEIDEIDEDTYWFESWWTCTADGACRLEADLVPTLWQPVPEPSIAIRTAKETV